MNITQAQLQQYHTLDQQRKALSRQVRMLEKEQKELEVHIVAYMKRKSQDKIKRGHFVCLLTQGRPSVSWKDEVIRLAGPEHAAALLDSAPRKSKIEVKENETA